MYLKGLLSIHIFNTTHITPDCGLPLVLVWIRRLQKLASCLAPLARCWTREHTPESMIGIGRLAWSSLRQTPKVLNNLIVLIFQRSSAFFNALFLFWAGRHTHTNTQRSIEPWTTASSGSYQYTTLFLDLLATKSFWRARDGSFDALTYHWGQTDAQAQASGCLRPLSWHQNNH